MNLMSDNLQQKHVPQANMQPDSWVSHNILLLAKNRHLPGKKLSDLDTYKND